MKCTNLSIHLLSLNKSTPSCAPNPHHDKEHHPRKSPLCPCPRPLPPSQPLLWVYCCFRISYKFIQYELFCTRPLLFQVMFYADELVSYDVACVRSLFPPVTEQYPIVWYIITVFFHSFIDRRWRCFEFQAIIKLLQTFLYKTL